MHGQKKITLLLCPWKSDLWPVWLKIIKCYFSITIMSESWLRVNIYILSIFKVLGCGRGWLVSYDFDKLWDLRLDTDQSVAIIRFGVRLRPGAESEQEPSLTIYCNLLSLFGNNTIQSIPCNISIKILTLSIPSLNRDSFLFLRWDNAAICLEM